MQYTPGESGKSDGEITALVRWLKIHCEHGIKHYNQDQILKFMNLKVKLSNNEKKVNYIQAYMILTKILDKLIFL